MLSQCKKMSSNRASGEISIQIVVFEMSRRCLCNVTSITSISSGLHHVVAVTSNGRVFAAPTDGKGNEKGQLGIGHTDVTLPSEFGYTKWYIVENTLKDIKAVQVAAGDNHSVVR
jgi:alpha-tubulin suppressor-like RCC1 family protein